MCWTRLNSGFRLLSFNFSLQRRKEEKERNNRYAGVMKSLVWRYVSAMHRRDEESPVTEDDVNEVKMEISSMRYEILEIFEKNGMDISGADKREKTVLAKKMKVWERRLMKDFDVSGVQGEEGEDAAEEEPPENETGLSRFKRAALKVANNTAGSKWGQVMVDVGVVTNSQIGRCRSRQSFKNQQNLQKAMQEARRLVLKSPETRSGATTPINLPEEDTLMKLLKNIAEELHEISPGQTLAVDNNAVKKGHSRSTTPVTSDFLQNILVGKSPLPVASRPKTPEMRSKSPSRVKTEARCKSPAPPPPPPDIRSPISAKRPDTPKADGLISPPPLIQITHHEPTIEERDDTNGTTRSPLPPPPPEVDNKTPLPKKRVAPSPSDCAVVSRPVAAKPPVNQGMIPPPPPSRKVEPAMSISSQDPISVSVVKPPPCDSIITIPRCESPLPTIVSITTKDDNMTITMESGRSTGGGSQEKLVPTSPSPSGVLPLTPSPVRLRQVRRVDDSKPARRQPKTGWL